MKVRLVVEVEVPESLGSLLRLASDTDIESVIVRAVKEALSREGIDARVGLLSSTSLSPARSVSVYLGTAKPLAEVAEAAAKLMRSVAVGSEVVPRFVARNEIISDLNKEIRSGGVLILNKAYGDVKAYLVSKRKKYILYLLNKKQGTKITFETAVDFLKYRLPKKVKEDVIKQVGAPPVLSLSTKIHHNRIGRGVIEYDPSKEKELLQKVKEAREALSEF